MSEWMFSPEYQEWLNDLGERIPESWDDDAAMEDVLSRYVRTLEDRCDAAGVSRERLVLAVETGADHG